MTPNSRLSAIPNLNILNPKSLEKQLKILEGHISELQLQIDELEKMRSACLVLLGTVPADPNAVKEEAPKSLEGGAKKKKPTAAEELTPRILELIRQKEEGLSADEIFDTLRSEGASIPGKRPVATVYSLLEQSPHVFCQNEAGLWIESKDQEIPNPDLTKGTESGMSETLN